MSTVEDAGLSDIGVFAALSIPERSRLFAELRAHRPVAFFAEPEVVALKPGDAVRG